MTALIVCGLALLAGPRLSADDKDVAARFKAMDTDGDGRISQAEFTASQQKAAAKVEANNDSAASAGEKAAAKPAKKHWWSRSDSSSDSAAATAEAAKLFAKMDTNSDGYLSESEFTAGQDLKK